MIKMLKENYNDKYDINYESLYKYFCENDFIIRSGIGKATFDFNSIDNDCIATGIYNEDIDIIGDYDIYDYDSVLEFVEKNGLVSFIKDTFKRLTENVNYYKSGYEGYCIELHANHTLYEIDKEIDEYFYQNTVNTAVETFEENTGVKIYLLGRSGRHVCVENTFENLSRYAELKQRAEHLEKWVIQEMNNAEDIEDIEDEDY